MPTFDQIQQEIEDMLVLPHEDLTDEQRAALDSYLSELADMEAGKVDAFGQFLKMQSTRVEACKHEAQRLAAKARATESNIAKLKRHYLEVMRQRGLKKVSGNAYTISVGELDVVSVSIDAAKLPDLFIRRTVSIQPDKPVIKEALKAGVEIEGCSLEKSHFLRVA